MDLENFKKMFINCLNSESILDSITDKVGNYYKFKEVLAQEFMDKKETEMKFVSFSNGI